MKQDIYKNIIQSKKKKLAVLVDPDKTDNNNLNSLSEIAALGKVDFFLIGGSLTATFSDDIIKYLKTKTKVPVILFPGNLLQFSPDADAILLLSLISGRNPELLIGNHVAVAPVLKKSKMEVMPTGYILVNTGKTSSVEYISNTTPVPEDKEDIVLATALAGEFLGMKLIYLEAGSGADKAIAPGLISKLKNNINIPLIVGGGIRTEEDVKKTCDAGADIIVLGTVAEKKLQKISSFSDIIHSY